MKLPYALGTRGQAIFKILLDDGYFIGTAKDIADKMGWSEGSIRTAGWSGCLWGKYEIEPIGFYYKIVGGGKIYKAKTMKSLAKKFGYTTYYLNKALRENLKIAGTYKIYAEWEGVYKNEQGIYTER